MWSAPRTGRSRPAASRRSRRWCCSRSLSLAALVLALQLNRLTLLYAVAGAFLAVTYPFVKRFLSVPQLYLGVAFGWGIPMAFAAQIESVPQVAWLLLLANVLWVTVYDTIYAMVDRDDDIKIGVRSTAILFGDSDRHIIAVLQAMTLASLYLAGKMIRAGGWYSRRPGRGRAVLHLSAVADSRARPRRVLSRLPQQQLFRHVRLHRSGARVFIRSALSEPCRLTKLIRPEFPLGSPLLRSRGRHLRCRGRAAGARSGRLCCSGLQFTTLTPRVVLDAGAGTGHASRALKRRYPKARVHCARLLAAACCAWPRRQQSWLRPLRARLRRCGASALARMAASI